jgi:MoaA/NifB/PqqE/SkfB family radical SAM enzyme
MIWADRIKVMWRSLACPEAWTLPPRQSLGLLKYLRHTRPVWHAGRAELNAYSPPVGGAGYGRYLRGLHRMHHGQWTPLVAHLSVTDRCPNACARCSNLTHTLADPPLDPLVQAIDQLRAAGTARLAFTGGEPLLRSDLEQLVAAARDLAPLLFTTGHGLDARRAQALHAAGLSAIFISLDHHAAGEHDRLRRRPGAFREACTAIRLGREAGLYTAAQTVVESPLLPEGELDRFLDFCQELGAQEVMLLEPVPVGHRPGQAAAADPATRARLAALHRRSARDATLPKVTAMSWLESPECLGCQAGFTFLYINTQGEVFPCDFVPASFGNIFELGIGEIQARMVRRLGSPARGCLALRLHEANGPDRALPLRWEQTQAWLADYQPGPLPDLVRQLYHGHGPPAS